ncbi:MAG TPA: hemerythrin domain-containing protein [Acidimicrobiales bacterium]|jgi:hemerythrin superfamily protein|nr:hemerythrin domain-containing protein [Acidimicrobiales bacterium]
MDAITLLKSDHRSVEKLFKSYEKAGDRAKATKRKLVAQMIKELSIHAAVEEEIFYPAARRAVEETAPTVLESLEEHHIVKWVLSELEGMDPGDERFDAKVTVLIELVRHHVDEEEHGLFPQVRATLGRSRLAEIGDQLEKAKRTAPTRPHPRQPDTPPANLMAGMVAGVVDHARDAVKEMANR